VLALGESAAGAVAGMGKGLVGKKNREKARASDEKRPGHDGRFQVGTRIVDDPYEPGKRYAAAVNVRESAIEHMVSRGRLNTAQQAACERFRKMWELAAVGRQRGIDITSGGGGGGSGVADPISDELIRAGQLLAGAIRAVGPRYSQLLISIVGEGALIRDVARRWAGAGGIVKGRQAAEGYITGTLIDAIDELVRTWRLVGTGREQLQEAHYTRNGVAVVVNDDIRASGPMTYTGPAFEIQVGKFGDVTREAKRPLTNVTLTEQSSGNLGSRARGRRQRGQS